MAIVRIQTPRDITWEMYRNVHARIEERGTPPGLIVHTAVDNDGKPQFIDVWETPEAAENFGQDWIGPVIAELYPEVAGPPEPSQFVVHEVRSMMRA